jgi:hypothetical protein
LGRSGQRLVEREKREAGRTISAHFGAVNWKMGKLTWDQTVAGQRGGRGISTASNAHMAVNAGTVVPAIDDEVVAFRL